MECYPALRKARNPDSVTWEWTLKAKWQKSGKELFMLYDLTYVRCLEEGESYTAELGAIRDWGLEMRK